MNAPQIQHITSSGFILLIACAVTWISFTQEPADAFVFPRLISVFFAFLALWNFVRASLNLSRVGDGMNAQSFKNILIGLLVIVVLVFFAAKFLGFYTASSLGFFCLFCLYDPASHRLMQTWIKRFAVTACFMLVIYGLFALLLQVQTPRGVFF